MSLLADDGTFETEHVRGVIQPQEAYHGVASFIDKRSGYDLVHPDYSALNLFRLFSTNQGMGMPRTMPRQVRKLEDGFEVVWPATEAHHAELTAVYRVVPPDAVDLTLMVVSQANYPAYEVFAPSYFNVELVPHIYLRAARYGGGTSGGPVLTVPTVNDVFRGTVLVFARDAHAARRCVDGRWDRKEFGSSIVQMCPVRHYAMAMAYVADEKRDIAAVLMSKRTDCYAISTRYHAPREEDRMTKYSAFDFSLFGDDLTPGDTRTVTMRLALARLSDEGVMTAYRQFSGETL